MHKLLILLSCLFILCASKCGDKMETSNCSTIGTVKDFTGMDGCQFLIILENGEKLQPMNEGKSKVDWKDGQRIRFDYYETTDHMSICMSGKMVIVSCLEILEKEESTVPAGTGGVRPMPKKCVETLDPFSKDFLQDALNKTNAYQVIRYTYRTDGWAYYFLGPKKNLMIDCQGTIICECASRDLKCDDKAKNYLDELVIFEKD